MGHPSSLVDEQRNKNRNTKMLQPNKPQMWTWKESMVRFRDHTTSNVQFEHCLVTQERKLVFYNHTSLLVQTVPSPWTSFRELFFPDAFLIPKGLSFDMHEVSPDVFLVVGPYRYFLINMSSHNPTSHIFETDYSKPIPIPLERKKREADMKMDGHVCVASFLWPSECESCLFLVFSSSSARQVNIPRLSTYVQYRITSNGSFVPLLHYVGKVDTRFCKPIESVNELVDALDEMTKHDQDRDSKLHTVEFSLENNVIIFFRDGRAYYIVTAKKRIELFQKTSRVTCMWMGGIQTTEEKHQWKPRPLDTNRFVVFTKLDEKVEIRIYAIEMQESKPKFEIQERVIFTCAWNEFEFSPEGWFICRSLNNTKQDENHRVREFRKREWDALKSENYKLYEQQLELIDWVILVGIPSVLGNLIASYMYAV